MDVEAIIQAVQFPLVQYMDKDQLQDLLNKNERIEAMVQEQEMISTQKQQKEMVIVESQSLADFNLSQERRLMESRQKLLNLHKQNREARENYDRNKRQLDDSSSKYSLAVAKKMLETSASKKEDDAEDIASNFMDGEMTADEFLESFQKCRHEAHTTRIKADKMTEMVGKMSNYVNTTIPIARTQPAPPKPAPRTAMPAYVPPQLSYDKPTPPARNHLGGNQPYPPPRSIGGGVQYY